MQITTPLRNGEHVNPLVPDAYFHGTRKFLISPPPPSLSGDEMQSMAERRPKYANFRKSENMPPCVLRDRGVLFRKTAEFGFEKPRLRTLAVLQRRGSRMVHKPPYVPAASPPLNPRRTFLCYNNYEPDTHQAGRSQEIAIAQRPLPVSVSLPYRNDA